MFATFFLPYMHDRYFYVADIISIVYFLINKDKYYIPIIIQFISIYLYVSFLFARRLIPIEYVTILNFVVVLILTIDMFRKMNISSARKEE